MKRNHMSKVMKKKMIRKNVNIIKMTLTIKYALKFKICFNIYIIINKFCI